MRVLDTIESEYRKEVRAHSRKFNIASGKQIFAFAACVGPFVLFASCFVPILGQVLGLLSIVLTVAYLYRMGSLRLILSYLAGFALAIPEFGIMSSILGERAPFLFYISLGICSIVTFGYLIAISAMLWSNYESSSEKLRRIN